MDNIGFCVFGRPKGIESYQNGLIAQNKLEEALYLDPDDVILQEKQFVICIEQKVIDGRKNVLISLNQQAYQHLEKRSGGFVGSAIAFVGYQVKGAKVFEGLRFLFKQVSQHVDKDGKFDAPSSKGWKIQLPDVSQAQSVFTKDKIIGNKVEKGSKICVLVTDLMKGAEAILEQLLINSEVSVFERIYITSQKEVFQDLQSKGAKTVNYSTFFNYEKHNARLSAQYNQVLEYKKQQEKELIEKRTDAEKEIFDFRQRETSQILKEKSKLQNEIKSLENEKITLQNTIEVNKSKINQQTIDLNDLKEIEKGLGKAKNEKKHLDEIISLRRRLGNKEDDLSKASTKIDSYKKSLKSMKVIVLSAFVIIAGFGAWILLFSDSNLDYPVDDAKKDITSNILTAESKNRIIGDLDYLQNELKTLNLDTLVILNNAPYENYTINLNHIYSHGIFDEVSDSIKQSHFQEYILKHQKDKDSLKVPVLKVN